MNTTTRGRYRRPRRLTHPLAIAVAFVAGVVLLIGACSADDRTPAQRAADEQVDAEQAAYDAMTDLQRVADDCYTRSGGDIRAADAGRTLLIDHQGEDDGGIGATIDEVVCVFFALDVPDALLSRIDSTRALDGTQSGEWDGYTAVWSYHPDSGLNIIIEDAS